MKSVRNERFPLKSILVAIGIGLIAELLMFCLAALVLTASDVSPSAISTISLIILLIGALLAGLLAAKGVGERGLLIGAIVGVGMFVLAFLISLILGQVSQAVFVKGAALVVGSSIGGVIGVNRHKRVRH